MSAPIFYISAEEYETLTPGASFELDGPEGKHALVKRMEVGESIDLGDGTGRRAVGAVHSLTDRGVIVHVEQLHEEHTSPRIYLVQALAKDGRDLLAIETATELGVYGVGRVSVPPRRTPSGRTRSPPPRSSPVVRSFPRCTTCTVPPIWWSSSKRLPGRVRRCLSCTSRPRSV